MAVDKKLEALWTVLLVRGQCKSNGKRKFPRSRLLQITVFAV